MPAQMAGLKAPGAPTKSGAPDWDSLLRKQQAATLAGSIADSGNSMLGQMGPAGWQFTMPKSVLPALASMPLQMAKERKGYEQRDLTAQTQRAALEAGAASNDHASHQSQRAREAWKAMGLPTPEGFDSWSASDIKAAGAGDFVRVQQLRAQAEERKAKEKAAADEAEAKAKAAEAKAGAAASDLENSRKNFAEILQQMGIDPETASHKDIDRAVRMREAALGRSVTVGNRDDAEAAKLAKDIGDASVFDEQYNAIMKLAEENGGRLPGVGRTEGLKQSVDSLLGTELSSPQAIEARKSVMQLANSYRQAITGAGASEQELARLNQASADVDSNDDRQVLIGLKTLKRMYDAKRKAAKAGVRKSIVDRVDPEKPAAASPGKRTPGGKPFSKKQVDTESGAVRYLDEAGNVIEQTAPSRTKATAPVVNSDDEDEEEDA
jgi:hypothetical protein